MTKDFLLITGVLAGTIIGAGIFSLPYIFGQIGIIAGFFYLILFASVYFVIHLMYAKIIETKNGEHNFFFFAKNYLPSSFSKIASFIILLELFFVLTIYLILAPTFANVVFQKNGIEALLIFWFLGSIFIFARLSFINWAEFLGTLSIIFIVGIVFFSTNAPSFQIPVFKKINLSVLFLPFGPLLFSLAGRPAISKVVEEYKKIKAAGRNISLNKIIFWGTFTPAVVYFLFALSILRINPNISPETLNSLSFLSPTVVVLLGILGLITLWTSYFIIGINIKDILQIDLKRSAKFSSLVVLFAPLSLYFLGFKNFLSVIGLTGGIFLALEGIFIVMMWQKAFPKKWTYFTPILFFVFSIAIIYEILSFIF